MLIEYYRYYDRVECVACKESAKANCYDADKNIADTGRAIVKMARYKEGRQGQSGKYERSQDSQEWTYYPIPELTWADS
jgi:hypothetical protein